MKFIKAVNWWIFNSFGGPTLDQSDIDPATGAPTVYKGETLFNALRAGKVLTLQNGDKVERLGPKCVYDGLSLWSGNFSKAFD